MFKAELLGECKNREHSQVKGPEFKSPQTQSEIFPWKAVLENGRGEFRLTGKNGGRILSSESKIHRERQHSSWLLGEDYQLKLSLPLIVLNLMPVGRLTSGIICLW